MFIAAGFDVGIIKIWDGNNNYEKITELLGHNTHITSLCFSPNGTELICGYLNGIIQIWNLITSEEITTLNGHTSSIKSICFFSDGNRLATGSSNEIIKIWDCNNKYEELNIFNLNSLCFSTNGSSPYALYSF